MRDRYFYMYQCLKYKECFYCVHFDRAKKENTIYSLLTIAISIFSVLVWTISKSMPALWAIVIAVAQFAQMFSAYLPWTTQLTALKYLLPALTYLLQDIDRDWLALDIKHFDDKKIMELVSEYERRYTDLENQFTSGIKFSTKESILQEAKTKQLDYFRSRYHIPENLEERRTTANAR